jgi:hypothetical protein
MSDTRNPYVSAASEILFGDQEWVHKDYMIGQMDHKFTHEDGRLVSINDLAAELEAAANV